jgi:hypothetical protein
VRLTHFADKNATEVVIEHKELVGRCEQINSMLASSTLPNDPVTWAAMLLFVALQRLYAAEDGKAQNAIADVHAFVDAIGLSLKDRRL